MTPYYEHNGITIYHGDCREILAALAPQSVDLIVTDPPYGIAYQSHKAHTRLDVLRGDESGRAAADLFASAFPAAINTLRRGRHVYVFGRFDLSAWRDIAGRCELVWDKGSPNGGGDWESAWASQHEYIQFGVRERGTRTAGRGAVRLRKGTVLRVQRDTGSRKRRHPTEKPTLLLRELIESSSRIGERVLDPFAGSGSTLEAAQIEGRHAIGIEIEERYCEIAAKRLSQEALPLEVVGA